MLGTLRHSVNPRAQSTLVPGGRAWLRKPTRVLLLLMLLGGCYWLRYGKILETHLQVLESFATKLSMMADAKMTVAPERWGEFTYPLERAREFAAVVGSRAKGRRSFLAFERVVEIYGELAKDPSILARADAPAFLSGRLDALREAASAARTGLAAGD